ncbi:TetR/AcrR family transcriptional regulator [Ancylobacter defluvii]|uniref:TetR family transcriptional regulator n=1 Tax=Ancylobacter defluvii TaxID=1282440 RepID=A0A9W6JT87_9HYPH|nr:TetR/AcrR family transcriptional regulator [Ancylobacter defluvii]MBS7587485.1 TetR/AcrR family transcriptional regulator [Ancylobacter defluvii]GLK82176.1 TetR family transcriptional regulator [Ancylobacter defluvii]
MNWSRNGETRSYHHGNLREALMQGTLDLIAEKGIAGVTFAEAARRAGVSAAAPYRHFRDRDELIAAVATTGFDRFAEALKAAWQEGRPSPAAAYERMGRAYLDFARHQPSYYIAMFESGVPLEAHEGLQAAGAAAFAVLREAAEVLVSHMPGRPPALMVALHTWSLAHGVASLFARADGARRKLPMTPDELLEAGFLVYLKGLGGPSD